MDCTRKQSLRTPKKGSQTDCPVDSNGQSSRSYRDYFSMDLAG